MISGPGGVGKGTVVACLVDRDDQLWLSRSWTTRDQRPGESDDAYTFVDRAAFEQRVEAGGFLEHAEFLENLYGSPFPERIEGRDLILENDVQGAAQIREREPDALLIYLDAPSPAVQEQRLRMRGDAEEQIASRLAHAAAEQAAGEKLGAIVVVNDRLDDTVDELHHLIVEARRRAATGG